MPKSRKRPRAAAKAAAARRSGQGPPRHDPRPIQEITADLSGISPECQARIEMERIWSLDGAWQDDLPDTYEFAGPPWSVWLAARDAGAPPATMAALGHHGFAYQYRFNGGWMTESMTLAEMIAGALPETIVSTSAEVSIGEAIESLAAEGVLRWDQDTRTAIDGPRAIAAVDAEDEAYFRKFGHH